MGTDFIRAMLLASAGLAVAGAMAPSAAYAQGASYQLDIPVQSMGDALRALGRATKQNIVFDGAVVRGKKSVAVRGRMSAEEALERMLGGSGLVMSKGSGGALMVRAGNASSGVRQGQGVIEGRVTDAATGLPLKGALIEVIGTRYRASSDGLGNFRLAAVTAGEAGLRVSYLGRTAISGTVNVTAGKTTPANFSMSVLGDNGEEIVVTAYQSARGQALNQERTGSNSRTIISSDLLGEFEGTAISDSLRKASGIAFQPSPDTGEGQNIIVRGLAPDLSTVTFNGQRLAVNSGVDRSPSLNNILTDSISQITINKTLLPSQDGTGTGALIEIETKGPLDRPRRFASATIEHNQSGSDFLKEFNAAATVSAKLGSDGNFGLSASIQFRKRRVLRLSSAADSPSFGQYLPLAGDGSVVTSNFDIDPLTPFPYEEGVDQIYAANRSLSADRNSLKDLSATLSAQWEIGTHTTLRADYTLARQTNDFEQRTFNLTANNLAYEPLPVDVLNGEVRGALVWQLPGEDAGNLTVTQSYLSNRGAVNQSQVMALRGTTEIGRLTLDYSGGMSLGRNSAPDTRAVQFGVLSNGSSTPISYFTEEVTGNRVAGRVVSPFLPINYSDFNIVPLSAAGLTYFNDPASYQITQAYVSSGRSANDRYSAKASAEYKADWGPLRAVEAGAYYESSKSYRRPGGETINFFPNGIVLMRDLGAEPSEPALGLVGTATGIKLLPFAAIESIRDDLFRLSEGDDAPLFQAVSPLDERRLQTRTAETTFATYLQATAQLGRLEIIGGVRREQVKVAARNLYSPLIYDENFVEDVAFTEANSVLRNDVATAVHYLPRVLANFRFTERTVIRAGYFLTIAQPALGQLNDQSQIYLYLAPFFGPSFNQPALIVSKGNPDLKPARTHNFDLSLEHYDDNLGSLKIAGFYKETSNLIFANTSRLAESLDGVTLPGDPRFQDLPDNIFISVIQPVNAPYKSKLWGVELSAERRLSFLPGWLSGFGVYGNYTYTDSKTPYQVQTNQSLTGFIEVFDRYSSQPKHSGTASLTYSKKDVNASISYSHQSAYLHAFSRPFMNFYQEAMGTLNARFQYSFDVGGLKSRVYVEGTDLLRDSKDPSQRRYVGGQGGAPRGYTAQNYFGGRALRIGLSANF